MSSLSYHFVVALLLFASAGLASNSFKEFSADYDIGGATLIDAPESEPSNTHIYLRIRGDAAKDMYNIIESAAVRDACLDDGTLTKRAKNIQCEFDPKHDAYACYFSIDVNSNAIGHGAVC